MFNCKLTAESIAERIFLIRQYFSRVMGKSISVRFLDTRYTMFTSVDLQNTKQ